jgi:DNA-binding transcriptional LysR family regulator
MFLDLAELGEGVALGRSRSVQDRLDAGSLMRIPNFSIPLPDYINVYHNRQAPTKPSSRAFVKLLKNRIKLEVLEPSTNGL